MSFTNIFTDGVLVDLNIRKWTAERALQPEDLGLKPDAVPKAFKLGQKALVPREVIAQFNNLDYQARHTLTTYSYPFAFGNARFVPKKVFNEFIKKLEEISKEYANLANDFVSKYENYKIDMRPNYVQAAHVAYARFAKMSGYMGDEDEFVNNFLARVDTYYPPVKELREKFSLEYVVYQMAMPDLSQATVDDVVSEEGKAELVKDVYKSALYEKVHAYVDDIVSQLRGKADDVLSLFKNNLNEGKRISEASLNMIRNMISEYEKMDIIGDISFLDKMKAFKAKYIDGTSADKIREDFELKKNMYKELEELSKLASDKSAIQALSDAYRQKISL